jgi:multidrug efflux pump subunit AcrA (membrane-fusion protein)
MANEQAASEPSIPTPAAKTQPPNPVRRLTLIVIAIGAVFFVYGIAADRITPFTAQALVPAYLVRIAPEVGGRVIEIGIDTDQRIEAGTRLFRIDPEQYALAVRRAEAVRWGETGVMTFIVSHNSDVYEKDLGPDTAQAAAINVFNPDKSWDKADMTP